MSRIEVAHGADHRLKQASQTVYKQFLAGRPLLIFCSDLKRLEAFSQYLWGVKSYCVYPPLLLIIISYLKKKVFLP